MLVFIENTLWLLVLIGVMINIHELGHFWAARYFDVRVEAFSFGFGTRLFGFKRGETDYRFSLIPLGGYVKMAGEQAADDTVNDPRSVLAKPRWQRLIISFAGPFMNVVLAVGVLTGLYMIKYQRASDADLDPVIGHVAADSPAAKAGLQEGDRIVKLDSKVNPTWDDVIVQEAEGAYRALHLTVERGGKRVDTVLTPTLSEKSGVGYAGWDARGEIQLVEVESGFPADKAGLKKGDVIRSVNATPIHSAGKLQELTKNSGGKPVAIQYERDGQQHEVSVQPVFYKGDGPGRWFIGVGPQPKFNIITTRLSLPDAFRESLSQNGKNAMMIVEVLKGVIERRMSTKNLTGPIGIAQMSGEAAREGPSAFFLLMSMISLNLAIVNLLPIPIMDGGVILMLLVEMTMQRDLSLNVKEAMFKVGFVCIMLLVAFAIYNDISRILPAG
ncbi:putative membrane-associated zinc metalloprotease [Candidatus Sulfopaludibacter sp. SbA4]|nr:putative membrane-associated zinc metalloprotease [Candidatus Sulfopaludibacter sp. SbA4]